VVKLVVELTDAELRICRYVGEERRKSAIALNTAPAVFNRVKYERESPLNDIRGAECEYAASIILNLYWRPEIGNLGAPDLGGVCQVRSTIQSQGRLIIKPHDQDDQPYVLVVKADNRHFRVAGWMRASEGKEFPLLSEYGDPAHYIEQRYLHPIEEGTINSWLNKKCAWCGLMNYSRNTRCYHCDRNIMTGQLLS